MDVVYKVGIVPTAEEAIDLYTNSGLPRPVQDAERIQKMYEHSNLIVTAWDNRLLVGVSRCITDWVWSCYLADLSVREEYKYKGIGKELINQTRIALGDESMLLLLSVPQAMEYYPKVGFVKQESSFIINRKK